MKNIKAVDFISCTKCVLFIGGFTKCLHKHPCSPYVRKDKRNVMFIKDE